MSILATNDRADVTVRYDLETDDDRTYSTVQALSADGDWELRVTGAPDGTFVSEWFDAHATAAETDHGHDPYESVDETDFTRLLEYGAIAVGLVGSLAVVTEAVWIGRRE